ncbi:5'-3' exoribonuclease 2 [Loxospora ochrophaea]|nr:5'-3' exoribonuclease 2 [Loxospora ochrophaea]
MRFFVGNDFLPHLPSLDIRGNGIDTLVAIWRDNVPSMGGYVTKDGVIDLARAQFILDGLARQDDAIFRRRRQAEERKDANAKRRKLEEQNRNSSHYSGGGNFAAFNQRCKSPDYSTPFANGETSGKVPSSALPSLDLPLFTPDI